MIFHRARAASLVVGIAAASLTLAACGSSSDSSSGSAGSKKAAVSAADFGGMDALVTAAKKEGKLNAIALPDDWANYGNIIKGFEKKYGIKVAVENPAGSSQDEVNAITSRKGQGRAPDVVDLGNSFALSAAKQGLLAPYKVSTWNDIPANQKDATGLRYDDYGGYVSIGCDASKVKECPTTFADLLKPEYKGQVALNGDPTKSGSAFGGVYAAALASGGSLDAIQPGLDFFGKLKKSGNFNPVQSTPATVEKGETPISIDWDYLNASYAAEFKAKGLDWKVNIPTDGQYAQFYSQGINKWAPHPATARLWEEYLYSAEGQNLFLQGFSRPVELAAMQSAGTVDAAAAAALPPVTAAAQFPTPDQITAAQKAVADGWSKAVGG
ncbi:ABC transporter substrate-binding protein [Streptomyces sp. NBC_01190]|uniref:ABC transporter substrate-binding protein n=1 Tax=Streptomyces sp. NBC_01190 TaxID=2903767 RepID=UPI00386E80F6|nr:extracellular solute-binding protein [Streptomyces sp. NBC_01190]